MAEPTTRSPNSGNTHPQIAITAQRKTDSLDLSSLDSELIDSFDPVAQRHLIEGNYQKFFVAVLPTHGPVPQQVLDILPYFGFLKDNLVHRKVQDFYLQNLDNNEVDPNALTESRYNYIMNAGFGSRFIPPAWIEEFCDDDGLAAAYTKQSLTGKNLQQFVFTLQNLSAHKIEVEKTVYVHQHTSGQMVHLADIALEFLIGMPFWKLGPLPNRCTVYALYYTGRPLYKGKVKPSLERPIFIGHSRGDPSVQLSILKHKNSNLQVADFCVRLLLVDNRHYVRTVQGMLIEHYDPVWNNKRIGLKFGSIAKEQDDNLWVGYHIKQHPKALQLVDTAIAQIIGGEEEGKCLQQ